MGYPYPLPKKFLCGFVRIPGVVWRQEGVQTPQTPVALPLIALYMFNPKSLFVYCKAGQQFRT
jgi:hypothetical protein